MARVRCAGEAASCMRVGWRYTPGRGGGGGGGGYMARAWVWVRCSSVPGTAQGRLRPAAKHRPAPAAGLNPFQCPRSICARTGYGQCKGVWGERVVAGAHLVACTRRMEAYAVHPAGLGCMAWHKPRQTLAEFMRPLPNNSIGRGAAGTCMGNKQTWADGRPNRRQADVCLEEHIRQSLRYDDGGTSPLIAVDASV